MVPEHRLSLSKACQIVGFSRSALYKPRVNWAAKDAPVIAALNEMVGKRSRWGFWKCFHRLRADGHEWNHKKVHRVYCAMTLNLQHKTKKRVITCARQSLGTAMELNNIWALDFMPDTIYDAKPFRALNVMDEGNREALRIECATSIPSGRLVRVMDQLIEVYGKPQAIRMDNGPEMTSQGFMDWAERHGVKLIFIQPGKPNQNAFIERFNKSFRVEVLDANLFNSNSEVQMAADEWLMDYNEYRPHESLGDMPPAEFRPRIFERNVSTFKSSTRQGSLWMLLKPETTHALQQWSSTAKINEGLIFRGVRSSGAITDGLCESRISRICKTPARKAEFGGSVDRWFRASAGTPC